MPEHQITALANANVIGRVRYLALLVSCACRVDRAEQTISIPADDTHYARMTDSSIDKTVTCSVTRYSKSSVLVFYSMFSRFIDVPVLNILVLSIFLF